MGLSGSRGSVTIIGIRVCSTATVARSLRSGSARGMAAAGGFTLTRCDGPEFPAKSNSSQPGPVEREAAALVQENSFGGAVGRRRTFIRLGGGLRVVRRKAQRRRPHTPEQG